MTEVSPPSSARNEMNENVLFFGKRAMVLERAQGRKKEGVVMCVVGKGGGKTSVTSVPLYFCTLFVAFG